MRAGYQYARAEVIPAIQFERALIGDAAGDHLGVYIEALRRNLEELEREAESAVERAILLEGSRHTRKWVATVRAAANIDVGLLVSDEDLTNLLRLRVQENVGLIKSLSRDVAEKIERTGLGSILEGRGNRETAKILAELEGINKRRAKLIARDQASKLNGQMNQFRQEQAGIDRYRWNTTLDGRERDTHRARHGSIFEWKKPPSDGHPGKAINCRCSAIALVIIPEDVE